MPKPLHPGERALVPTGQRTVAERKISEWILGKQGGKVWTGFIWLRIGTSGGLVNMAKTFGFHKRWGISLADE
jgi:hypothetical protein